MGRSGEDAIGLFNGGGSAQFVAQLVGALSHMLWAVVLSFIVFGILKATIGLRVTEEEEIAGLDVSEHGHLLIQEKNKRVNGSLHYNTF